MQVFERDNALKMNFKPKKVTEKADIEIKADEQGNPVIDVGDGTISGGGLPEGGNEGDVLACVSAGGMFGHAPDFESGTIRKMYVNLKDLKYAYFDDSELLYAAFVQDYEYEEPMEARVEVFNNIVTVTLAEQFDDFAPCIAVNTSDSTQTDWGINLDAHSAYKITFTEEVAFAEKIEDDTYIFTQNEYYGTVFEEDGVDFNDVIHYISFEEPFDEVKSEYEWRPLPITAIEFTEVEGEELRYTCNASYDSITEAYLENGSFVCGVVSNADGSRLTVIAESYDEGVSRKFKMCPIGWSLPFSYMYYNESDGFWYTHAEE